MNKRTNPAFAKFLLLCAGGFIASVGTGLTSFGLGVYVFEQTGLATATTLITLLAFLPSLVLSPLAGVLADRYDRRLLMILGDGFSALGVGFILVCMLDGEASLWQIGIGVTVSSVFSALVEPAFRATVTDLLSEEEYTKASGFIQISGSAKYLLSPVLAGFLLAVSDIRLLLVIDICTIFITVAATFIVRKGIVSKAIENSESIIKGFQSGWAALVQKRGVLILTVVAACITFFLASIQTLSTPMILAFTDSSNLGMGVTISASGMLVSGLLLGIVPFKKGFVRMLSGSLLLAGVCMVGFGLREQMVVICVFGFLFFVTLPFANASLDYLIRTNVDNAVQGRVWGLIGIISQLGYVVAYAILGPLADYVFVPLLVEGGALANSVGKVIGVGSGRGIGLLIAIAGVLLAVTAAGLYRIRSVRELENGGKSCTERSYETT